MSIKGTTLKLKLLEKTEVIGIIYDIVDIMSSKIELPDTDKTYIKRYVIPKLKNNYERIIEENECPGFKQLGLFAEGESKGENRNDV